MSDSILQALILFIKEDRWGLGQREISKATRIVEDLRLTGDDAVEFIVAFGRRFHVDVSGFMVDEYFDPEGIDFLGWLRDLLGGEKKDRKALTVGDLERAIELKKLI